MLFYEDYTFKYYNQVLFSSARTKLHTCPKILTSSTEAWKSLTDKVQEARSNARLKKLSFEGKMSFFKHKDNQKAVRVSALSSTFTENDPSLMLQPSVKFHDPHSHHTSTQLLFWWRKKAPHPTSLLLPGVNGLRMLGVVHEAVVFLLEQLYGTRHCRSYRFRFHKPEETDEPPINPHGSARAEVHQRSGFDSIQFI